VSKHKHILSNIDLVKKTASCKECGLTTIYVYPNGKVKCRVSKRQQNKFYKRAKKYKVSTSVIRTVLKEACEACGKREKLCVDHNHDTGLIRGTLCHGCNVALGFVRENPETLRALARYIERQASLEVKLHLGCSGQRDDGGC